jgi:hypothetical protein
METETVDVIYLNAGEKVKVLESVFVVDGLSRSPFTMDLVLLEVDGRSWLELHDVSAGTLFERVVPDPEEFRVRSVSQPRYFFVEFKKDESSDWVMVNAVDGGTHSSVTVDLADLKAVVEKL